MNKTSLYITLAAVSTFGFVSCAGEDDPTVVDHSQKLVSSWELTQIGQLNEQGVINYMDINPANCEQETLTFMDNGTFSDMHAVDGGEAGCQTQTETGTYVLSNGDIHTTVTEGETEVIMTYDILTFTDTTLELTYTNTEGELVFARFMKPQILP